MGGKSSSSSSQSSTTTNETLQAESSGVLTGNLFQGQDVTYTSNFGPEVQKAFGELIDLSEQAGDIAQDLAKTSINEIGGVFERLLNLTEKSIDVGAAAGEFALQQVADKATQREQPELSVISTYAPILTIAVVGIVAWLILKKG